MRKNTNTIHVEGRIYQHTLEVKTVQNQKSENFGKPFIKGVIEVATEEYHAEKPMQVIRIGFSLRSFSVKQNNHTAQNRCDHRGCRNHSHPEGINHK